MLIGISIETVKCRSFIETIQRFVGRHNSNRTHDWHP
jgi:hypothetical protein